MATGSAIANWPSVALRLGSIVHPRAIGPRGATVPRTRFSWSSSDRHILEVGEDGQVIARGKGHATLSIKTDGCEKVILIPVEVWQVDHVLLTPRNLRVEVGKRKQIVAEITNDEGIAPRMFF